MTVAATPEGRIFDALMRRLASFPGGRRLVPPNTVYPVGSGAKDDEYIVVSHAPNVPLRTEISDEGEKIRRGIFGMSVMTRLGVGESGRASDVAGALAAHFDCQRLTEGTTTVRIVNLPQVGAGYVDGDRWRVPVTAEYETIRV